MDKSFLPVESANIGAAMSTQTRQLLFYQSSIARSYIYMYILLIVDVYLVFALILLSLQRRGLLFSASLDTTVKLILLGSIVAFAPVLYLMHVLVSRKNTDFSQINMSDPPPTQNPPGMQTSLRKSGRLLAATSQDAPCVNRGCCPSEAGSGNPYWNASLKKCVL